MKQKNKKLRRIIHILLMVSIFLFISPRLIAAQTLADCDENLPIDECFQQEEDLKEEAPLNEKDEANKSSSFSFLKSFIQMIFALLLILALIYFMVKVLGRKNKALQESNLIENLGGLPLGQNKSIQLIRIGDQVMVIGVGDNIELLYEITDQHTISKLQDRKEAEGLPQGFLQMLNNKLQQSTKKEEKSNRFEEMFKKELDHMKLNREKIIEEHKDRKD